MIPTQPGMQNNQQPDPMIQKVTMMISESVKQGKDIVDVVTELSTQEIDQQVIAQALMMGGMEEVQIQQVFQEVVKRMQPELATPAQVNQNPQELARNESVESEMDPVDLNVDVIDEYAKSGIEIKKENRGKFTKWAKARGMGVQEAARKVLANKEKYSTEVVKMANFARNAAKFKKQEGGEEIDMTTQLNLTLEDLRGSDFYTGLEDPERVQAIIDNVLVPINTGAYSRDMNGVGKFDAYRRAGLKKLKEQAPQMQYGGMGTIADPNPTYKIDKNYNYDVINAKPFYINPVAFEDGDVNYANIFNTLRTGYEDMFSGKDLNKDGVKDGTFRDWQAKKDINRSNKFKDAEYSIKNMDEFLSEDNMAAMQKYVDLLKSSENANEIASNIDVGNFNETVTGGGLGTERMISNLQKDFKDWAATQKENLGNVGNATLEALQKMFPQKQDGGAMFPQQDSSDIFDFNVPFLDYSTSVQMVEDEEFRQRNPLVGPTPAQQQNQATLDSLNEQNQQGMQEKAQAEAQAAFDEITPPEININTGGIEGAYNRFRDSNFMRGFEDVSDVAVQLAPELTKFAKRDDIFDAQVDNRMGAIADERFNTYTQPFNYKGTTDINTGRTGADSDYVTGLYMNSVSEYGGEKGEAAYLANRDKVIKREMAKAQDGGSLTSESVKDSASARAYYNYIKNLYNTEETRVNEVRDNILGTSEFLDQADDRMFLSPSEGGMSDEDYQLYRDFQLATSRKEMMSAYEKLPQMIKDALPKTRAGSDTPYSTLGTTGSNDDELYCTPYGCFAYQQAGAYDMPTLGGNYSLTEKAYGSKFPGAGSIPFELISDDEAELGDMVSMYSYAPTTYRGKHSNRESWRPHHTGIYSGPGEETTSGTYDEDGMPVMQPTFNAYQADSGTRLDFNEGNFPMVDGPYDQNDPNAIRGEDPQFLRYVGQLPKIQTQLDEARNLLKQYNIPAASVIESQPIQSVSSDVEGYPLNFVSGLDLGQTGTRRQEGGETVNVDSSILAKLIAAGADIEML